MEAFQILNLNWPQVDHDLKPSIKEALIEAPAKKFGKKI
jgi:hypothetical protein